MRYLSQCEKMEGNIYIKLLCYYIISWSLELGPSLLTSVGNHPEVALSQLWRHCSHYRPRVSSFHRRHAEESVNYTNISFYVSIYYHSCLWEWRPPTLILKVFFSWYICQAYNCLLLLLLIMHTRLSWITCTQILRHVRGG